MLPCHTIGGHLREKTNRSSHSTKPSRPCLQDFPKIPFPHQPHQPTSSHLFLSVPSSSQLPEGAADPADRSQGYSMTLIYSTACLVVCYPVCAMHCPFLQHTLSEFLTLPRNETPCHHNTEAPHPRVLHYWEARWEGVPSLSR